VTERVVRAGDVELWSEAIGAGDDPPLLLIAPDCQSSTGWPDALVELIASGGRRVIRYDHRDTGRSTWRDFAEHPYSFDTLAADAVAVLDGWDVPAAHVFGFGMGGGLGQLLALDHAGRLRTLSVGGCFALGVDFFGNWARALSGEPTRDGLPTPRRWFAELAFGEIEMTSDEIWRVMIGDEEAFDEAEAHGWERRADEHAGRRDTRGRHPHGELPDGLLARGPELGRITTPTLVIQGMLDPVNPPPHGRHLAGLLPDARLVEIPGLGHALPRAVHARVADAVLAHTRGDDLPPGASQT
jgi:10-carbomethoxy-13-deoxycarminomycin esterase/esterase